MKKLVLAASLAAIAATSAHAAPKVYGKAFATLDYEMMEEGKDDEASKVSLNSNASRIGFKGSEKLGNGLKALYKAEYQIAVDDGDAVFKQRNIYVGLSSDQLGTLLAGNMDSPLKTAQKKVDLFNDFVGGNIDMKKTLSGEVRAANVLAYVTPKMQGVPVSLTLATNLSEKTIDDNGNEDRDNGYHAKLAYEANGLYAAIAGAWDAPLKSPVAKYVIDGLDEKVPAEKAAIKRIKTAYGKGDTIRLVGQYKMGGTQLGALFQVAEPDSIKAGVNDETAFLLSAKHKIAGTPFAVKGQYQQSSTDFRAKGVDDLEISQFALGGEYSFSKATKAHAYFGVRNYEMGAADADYSVVGTGIEHKF